MCCAVSRKKKRRRDKRAAALKASWEIDRLSDALTRASDAERQALEIRLAAEVAGLRHARRRVASLAAIEPTTQRLALELALLAFAEGDDARAASIAERHPIVESTVGALVAASRGEPIAKARRGGTALARALNATARAVAACRQGDVKKARAQLNQVPVPAQAALLTNELRAALTLEHEGRGRSVSLGLLHSPVVRGDAELESLAARLAAKRAPHALVRQRSELSLPPAALADGIAVAFSAIAGTNPSAEQLAPYIGEIPESAFAPSERGNALLHRAFALAPENPDGADRLFERAIEAGADVLECLRGKLLLCAARRGTEHRANNAGARLWDALANDRFGAPLAFVLAGKVADVLASVQPNGAATWAARALAHADERGFSGPSVRSLRILGALLPGVLPNPEEELNALIAVKRTDPEAWKAKVMLLREHGQYERAEETVFDAAEATNDADLIATAAELRRKRRGRAPLVPGQSSAGELAAQIQAHEGRMNDAMEAVRASLDASARTAVDAVRLLVLMENGSDACAQALLERLLETADSTTVHELLLAAVAAELDVRALAQDDRVTPEQVHELFLMALACDDEELAERFLFDNARRLGHRALSTWERELRAHRRGIVERDPCEHLLFVDERLAPELSLSDLATFDDRLLDDSFLAALSDIVDDATLARLETIMQPARIGRRR
jgi:tetratricopeptide (TPR) repeat protein